MAKALCAGFILVVLLLALAPAPSSPPCESGRTVIRLASDDDLATAITQAEAILGPEFSLIQVGADSSADARVVVAELDGEEAGRTWGQGWLTGRIELAPDTVTAWYAGHVLAHELVHKSGWTWSHDDQGLMAVRPSRSSIEVEEKYRASLRALGRCE